MINRSRTHPHPHQTFDSADHPSGSNGHLYHTRRHSEFNFATTPRIGTIQEASYDEGAAVLLGDDDETSALLDRESKRRKSYGATGGIRPLPLGVKSPRRRSASGPKGSSRSRSQVRTPPRKPSALPNGEDGEETCPSSPEYGLGQVPSPKVARGRPTDSRSLSRASSPLSISKHTRRQSHAYRLADDSSGDEGGDVARRLVAGGGEAIFAGRAGLGILSTTEPGVGGMDVDPVVELNAQDLELPVAKDGLEVRVWTEALRACIPNTHIE